MGICAAAMAAKNMDAKSSPSVCFECVDTTLHDSVQESQSRGWDESSSPGASSLLSQGQPLEHLSGASCDFSCATPSLQHSTRIPARQSVGIPTKLQTTAMSARIRMVIVYATLSRASTNFNLISVPMWKHYYSSAETHALGVRYHTRCNEGDVYPFQYQVVMRQNCYLIRS